METRSKDLLYLGSVSLSVGSDMKYSKLFRNTFMTWEVFFHFHFNAVLGTYTDFLLNQNKGGIRSYHMRLYYCTEINIFHGFLFGAAAKLL